MKAQILNWLNNLMLPKPERRKLPARKYLFTFYLVGLDRMTSIVDYNRDDAARGVYDRLLPQEIEALEWADLVDQQEVIDNE